MAKKQNIPTWDDTEDVAIPTWDDTEDVKKKVGEEVSESSEESTSLAENREKEFQNWLKTNPNVVAWREEFKKEYGEEPEIDNSGYDYRGAFEAGIVPEKNETDGLYHWDSIGIDGKDLKSKTHPTRWKSEYMKLSGNNPDEIDIDYEKAVSEYPELKEFNPSNLDNKFKLSFQEEKKEPYNYLGLFDKQDKVKQANELGVSVSFAESMSEAASKAEYPLSFLADASMVKKKLEALPKYFPQYSPQTDVLKGERITPANIETIKSAIAEMESQVYTPPTGGAMIEVPTGANKWNQYENETKKDPQLSAIKGLEEDTKRLKKAATGADYYAVGEAISSAPTLGAEVVGGALSTGKAVLEGRFKDVAKGTGQGVKQYVEGYTKLNEELRGNRAVVDLMNKLEGDESLTSDDKLLLKAIVDNANLHKELDKEIPTAYKVGESLGQSLGFMAEYVATGGGLGSIGKGIAVTGAKQLALGALVKTAQAGIQTAKMPSLYQKTAQAVSNGQDFGTAFIYSYWDTFAENFSERVFMKNPLNGSGVNATNKIMQRLGINFNVEKGAVGVLRNTLEEAAEEKIGELITAPKDYKNFADFWKGYTDKEQNLIMLGSVGLMTGTMGSVAVAGNSLAETRRKGRMKRLDKFVPNDLRGEIDIILDNKDLSVKQQYDLIAQAITERLENEDLGEDPATTTENAMLYAQYGIQNRASQSADENAVVKDGEITLGTVEEVGGMQDQVDYLKGQGVEVNGLNGTQVEELYKKTKAQENKQAEDKAVEPTIAEKPQVEPRVEPIKTEQNGRQEKVQERTELLGEQPEVKTTEAGTQETETGAKTAEEEIIAYHGTTEDFTEFDESKIGKTDSGWFGRGFYFHTDKDRGGYGDIVKKVKIKLKNPLKLPVDYSGRFLYDIIGERAELDKSWRDESAMNIIKEIGSDKFTQLAKELGYDGVIVENAQGTKEIVAFGKESLEIQPSQAKTRPSEPLSQQKGTEVPLEEKVVKTGVKPKQNEKEEKKQGQGEELLKEDFVKQAKKEENKERLGRIFDNVAKLPGTRVDITGEERKNIRKELIDDIVEYVKTEFELVGDALREKVKSFIKDNKIQVEDLQDEEILKSKNYAKGNEGTQVQDGGTEAGQERGTGDSNLPSIDQAELQDGKETEKEKVRQFGKKVTESTILPEDIKETIKKNGIGYVPRGRKVTKKEARELIRIYSESGGMDRVKAEIFNPSISVQGDTRIAMAVAYVNDRISKSKQTLDPIEAAKLRADAADVLEFYKNRSTLVAQELEGMKVWQDAIGQNPDFVVETVRAEMDKHNADFYDTYKKDIKDAQTIIEEFLNSDEFKNKYAKKSKAGATAAERKQRGINKIANGLDKLASLRGVRKNAVSENEIGENEFDALKEIASGILDVGVASVQELIAELKTQTRKYFSPSEIERVAKRIASETDAKNKLKPKTTKITLDKTDEEKLVDKLFKSMVIANRSQLKKLIADNIELFQQQGLIDDRSFRELVAKAMGRFYVSEKQLASVEKAAKKINDVKTVEENIDKLFDEYIQAVEDKDKPKVAKLNKEVAKQLREYKKVMLEAGIASSEIGSVFADSPTLVKMFATFIQGNLLTPASLKVNLLANTFVLPFRLGRNTLATGIDWLLSEVGSVLGSIGLKAENTRSLFWKNIYNTMLSEQRTFMSTGINKGMFSGLLRGSTEGIIQMWRGQAQDDINRRDISKALHPFEAWFDIYQSLKGEEKLRATEILNKFVEGTFGVPPEIMFRFLNLGDKPFRRAAEQSRLDELAEIKKPQLIKEFLNRIGTDKGLTGKELETFVNKPDKQSLKDSEEYFAAWKKRFMIRPDDASWEEARKAGLEAVYQNDNVLSDALKNLSTGLSNRFIKGNDWIDKTASSFLRFAFVANIPFIKTPTNVVIEALNYAVPPIPLIKAIYNFKEGNRRDFVKNMGTALIGSMMIEAVGGLFGLGILGLASGGGEEEPTKNVPTKVREAEYYYRPAYYLNNRALEDLWSNMVYGTNKDLTWKQGDTIAQYTRYGLLSSILMAHAEGYAGMTPDQIKELSVGQRQSLFLMPVIKSSLEQSYVKNVSALINAIKGNDYEQESYLVGLAKAMESAVIPNSYRSYQQAKDNYIRATREASLQGKERIVKTIENDFKASYDIGKMPPPRVNIWGEDVQRYQDGNSPIFRVFDITKERSYGNTFGIELFELYRSTQNNDVLPPDVPNRVKVLDQYVKVDGQLYHDLAQYAAGRHKEIVRGVINSDLWKTIPDDASKVEFISNVYKGKVGDIDIPTRSDYVKEFISLNKDSFYKLYKKQHGQEAYDDLMRRVQKAQEE